MIRFECDYGEGATQKILNRLFETNLDQTIGYGEDEHCAHARKLIKALCANDTAQVHFLVGGTQANMTLIAAALKPYQGAVAAVTGHINVHETGAIEATGHKVLPLQSEDGKITAAQARALIDAHYADPTREHQVQPGLVYISQPTENGTLYTKDELIALSNVCRETGTLLYVDGARLSYALAADNNDVGIADLARLTDAFYIGGTKTGALFGEAMVIMNPALQKDFRYHIKQRGGMLAKGRLLGIQFECLFEDDTYFKIAAHADALAMRLRRAFEEKGYRLLYDSKTNQQFPILPNAALDELGKKYAFSHWQAIDAAHTAVRFCTSWATKEENVDALIADMKAL